MPWLPDGTFFRDNSVHDGPTVWQQDDEAGYKIVDELHDIHDQDLAQGIEQSLNVNGFNSMLANLNMGGFTITNMEKGSTPLDAAQRGELASSLEFAEATRTLLMKNLDGDDIASVVIPDAGGGTGSGTVTSVDIGEGLTGASDPITVSGDISLETLSPSPAGTYSNGIGSLAIDKHGRVLSVASQAFGVDLGIIQNASNVVITNTKGNPATIPLVTTSLAGLMSKDDKAKLNALTSGGGGTVSDLSASPSTTSVSINNTGGDNATILSATTSRAGVMTAAQVSALNTALQSGSVDLGFDSTVTGGLVTNTAGDSAVLPIWKGDELESGLFIGETTSNAPANGASSSRPDGFIWFEF